MALAFDKSYQEKPGGSGCIPALIIGVAFTTLIAFYFMSATQRAKIEGALARKDAALKKCCVDDRHLQEQLDSARKDLQDGLRWRDALLADMKNKEKDLLEQIEDLEKIRQLSRLVIEQRDKAIDDLQAQAELHDAKAREGEQHLRKRLADAAVGIFLLREELGALQAANTALKEQNRILNLPEYSSPNCKRWR